MAGWLDGVMASYLRLLVDRDVVVIRDGQPEHTRLRGGWMAMTAWCRIERVHSGMRSAISTDAAAGPGTGS